MTNNESKIYIDETDGCCFTGCVGMGAGALFGGIGLPLYGFSQLSFGGALLATLLAAPMGALGPLKIRLLISLFLIKEIIQNAY